jgi:hypothetical protein
MKDSGNVHEIIHAKLNSKGKSRRFLVREREALLSNNLPNISREGKAPLIIKAAVVEFFLELEPTH